MFFAERPNFGEMISKLLFNHTNVATWKLETFFCLCCFFPLMILNAKPIGLLKANFGKDKNKRCFKRAKNEELMFFHCFSQKSSWLKTFATILTIVSFFLRQSNCFTGSMKNIDIFRKIRAKKRSYHFELRLDLNQNSWGEVLN